MNEIERPKARAEYIRVPSGAAVEIHPAVVDLARMADVRYLAADMSALTSLCADYLALVEPVIAVLRRQRYLVVAGFRSWQVATIMRRHEHGLFILLLGGRIDDDTARSIAVYDVMVHRQTS